MRPSQGSDESLSGRGWLTKVSAIGNRANLAKLAERGAALEADAETSHAVGRPSGRGVVW